MIERKPTTRTTTISDLPRELVEHLDAVTSGETRLVVERGGTPVAALVSANDLSRLQQLDRDWQAGTRALERFSEAFADVPIDELEAKIDQIIAEGRANDEAGRRSA